MSAESRSRRAACESCEPARRLFLREAAGTVAAILVALGASRAEAAAAPLALLSATRREGSERAYPLPTADGASIDRDADLIVARWHGRAWAFALTCPHQNTALRWMARDARFQCPKHKSKYQPDGTFISGRATRNMDRHAVRRAGGELIVGLAVVYRQDRDPAGWAAAEVAC